MKTVWLMNHYAAQMFAQHAGKHYWFARELRLCGYAPVVFCANTVHATGEVLDTGGALYLQKQTPDGFPFVFVRTTPYKGNGVSRIRNMLVFAHNLKRTARAYAREHGRPDVILASSVHPFTLTAGLALAQEFGVPCVCEIRDPWPESIVAYGVASKNNPAVRWMYGLEKRIYTRADAVIFTIPAGAEYIREKGWDSEHGGPVDLRKVYSINNGVDLAGFDANAAQYPLADPDLDAEGTFKIVYTGSIRLANNLGLLLDAAAQVRDPRVRFLLWGDGDKLEELRARAREMGLSNVCFKGRVERRYVPSILCRADANLLILGESDLFRFGMSMNKLFEYLAAAKPVLMIGAARHTLVETCGVHVPDWDAGHFARAAEALAATPAADYAALCANARETAGEYDYGVLSDRLAEILEEVGRQCTRER